MTPSPSSATGFPGSNFLARIINSPWMPPSFRPAHPEDPTAISFWGALNEAERRAFTTVASEHTFPRGTRIIEEGGQSGQVMVIRHGWMRVCVREDSVRPSERTVARRGPGQLIGERAALGKTVRSASVIADETVVSLV